MRLMFVIQTLYIYLGQASGPVTPKNVQDFDFNSLSEFLMIIVIFVRFSRFFKFPTPFGIFTE